METWVKETNQYGFMMLALLLGSIVIATQNIYVAIPFLGMALIALIGWSKEHRKVKQRFRVWGEPDTLTV